MAESEVNKSPAIVPTKQTGVDISGHPTDIVVNKFEDHLFIIITQYKKLGTIVEVSRDVISDEVQGHIPMFSTNVLLGKDEPLSHVIAKTIVTSLNPPIPVILTLALKETSHKTVQAITEVIKSCL